MMAADGDAEQPASPAGDPDTPDWTTWLRSRLERVSSSEGKGASTGAGAEQTVADGEHQDGDAAEPAPAPTFPSPDLPEPSLTEPAPSFPEPGFPEPASNFPEPAFPEPGFPELATSRVPLPPPQARDSPPIPAPVELEALRSAVTALVAGVGTLADTFSGFRSVVTERLDEYAKTVLRVTNEAAGEVEDLRKAHAGSTDELCRTVAELNDRLQHLAGGMDDLAAKRGDDDRWAEVMGRLLDDVDAERQAGQDQERAAEGVVERLNGLESGLQRLTADVAEVVAGQRRIAVDIEELAAGQHRVAVDVAEVVAGQHRVAVDLADVVAGQHRLAVDVAEVVAGQQSVAVDLAGMAEAQRLSADQDRPAVRLDDAQLLEVAEAVAAAAVVPPPAPEPPQSPPRRPSPRAPVRPVDTPPAAPRGRRSAPLRAPRKANPNRPSR